MSTVHHFLSGCAPQDVLVLNAMGYLALLPLFPPWHWTLSSLSGHYVDLILEIELAWGAEGLVDGGDDWVEFVPLGLQLHNVASLWIHNLIFLRLFNLRI
jgi:hypothetical protein